MKSDPAADEEQEKLPVSYRLKVLAGGSLLGWVLLSFAGIAGWHAATRAVEWWKKAKP